MAADVVAPVADALFSFHVTSNMETGTPTRLQTEAESRIQRFQSQAEALDALKQMAITQWSDSFGMQWGASSFHLDRESLLGIADISLPIVGLVSATDIVSNVQTTGVDEADDALFSNDGYVYVIRDQSIRVIDIRDPKDLKEVSRIPLQGTTAVMHLVGQKLIVASHGYQTQAATTFLEPNFYTQIKVYDVSAKEAPVFSGGFNVDGSTFVSRVVDGKLILVQNTRDAVPLLQMIQTDGDLGVWSSRYETQDEYLDRILPTLIQSALVNYQQIGSNGEVLSEGVLGDWRDLANAGGKQLTKVVSLDLNAKPKLDSMESLLGGWITNAYVTANSIYLTQLQDDGHSRITQFDLGNGPAKSDTISKRGISALAFGDVLGTIRDSRFMDEYDGHLRVVTSQDGSNSGGRIRNSANIFVLKSVEGQLQKVGSLLDISPGDQAYGVEFDGPRAFVTTGFIDPSTLRPVDPLHGMDLSDPTQPRELSDVIIPGITNYVQWVDSKHLLGIGMVEDQSQWFTQVSLYDVTDLSSPRTIDVWRGTQPIRPNFFGSINPLDIHFDSQSKTLTVPQTGFTPGFENFVWIDDIMGRGIPWLGNFGSALIAPDSPTEDVIVLAVDLEAEDPLSFRALVGDGSGLGRAAVSNQSLVVLTRLSLSTYAINAPTQVIDRVLLSNPLRPDSVYITDGAPTTIIPVLENDSRLVDYRITAIKRSGFQGTYQGTVRILEDQTLEYTRPTLRDSDHSWWENFIYEVTTAEGSKFETQVSLWGNNPNANPPANPPVEQTATATISAKAYGTDNQPIASIRKGDTFWIEVVVQDGRADSQGVYSAYVDLTFDTQSFEVVGQSQVLGGFSNGISGEITNEGWKKLGGFRDSSMPPGSNAQSLVRFQLRAIEDADLNLVISPSRMPEKGFTLYGIDTVIPMENIVVGSLSLPTAVVDYDVNADGILSPIDSLIVINRINREGVENASIASISVNASNGNLDVNKDGIISLLDALTLINRINRDNIPPESILHENAAVPMMNTVESNDITKRKG